MNFSFLKELFKYEKSIIIFYNSWDDRNIFWLLFFVIWNVGKVAFINIIGVLTHFFLILCNFLNQRVNAISYAICCLVHLIRRVSLKINYQVRIYSWDMLCCTLIEKVTLLISSMTAPLSCVSRHVIFVSSK